MVWRLFVYFVVFITSVLIDSTAPLSVSQSLNPLITIRFNAVDMPRRKKKQSRSHAIAIRRSAPPICYTAGQSASESVTPFRQQKRTRRGDGNNHVPLSHKYTHTHALAGAHTRVRRCGVSALAGARQMQTSGDLCESQRVQSVNYVTVRRAAASAALDAQHRFLSSCASETR